MTGSKIEYRYNFPLEPAEVVRVFVNSGINRPTDDVARIGRMFSGPVLTVSAWTEGQLIGVARSLTDYAYCCYMSDLAVDKAYQGRGIGRELVRRTQAVIGDEVTVVLVSAPSAVSYYPTLGFELSSTAFIIRRKS